MKRLSKKSTNKKNGNKKPGNKHFPTNQEILEFLKNSSGRVGKKEIARAFKLDSKQKLTLKKILSEMKLNGIIGKGRKRQIYELDTLPTVTILKVIEPDKDGDLMASPETWESNKFPPKIYLVPNKVRTNTPGFGERILARLTPAENGTYEARIIRSLATAPKQILGIFEIIDGKNRIRSIDRRSKSDFIAETPNTLDAKHGDIVRAVPLPGKTLGLRKVRIIECFKVDKVKKNPSLIAILDNDLPTKFSDEAIRQASKATSAPTNGRVDLRNIPLVTIDGTDARDFDDAVWAEMDTDKHNMNGWHLLVAIADVAWYVRPGDALDKNAYERGNSVYFPDQVVPMLPEALSNGWCSLNPKEDRPCIAVHLWIDSEGNLKNHQFCRGIMRSHARLNYIQVQEARNGNCDKITRPLLETVIKPLFGAYDSLLKNRKKRGVLELETPERKVQFENNGEVRDISISKRLDSHKLIEEIMILANVAAAKTLEKNKMHCLYRVHDEPSKEKLENLRKVLKSVKFSFDRGGILSTKRFNQVLKLSKGSPYAEMINVIILRSQSKAIYTTKNLGHFGLALNQYIHFTSPIRRYADLLTHRALINTMELNKNTLEDNEQNLERKGEHLSFTERRATEAERDSIDRFTAHFFAEQIGEIFQGYINGITRFGLFITLKGTGADGLVPIRTITNDYYYHEETLQMLKGKKTGHEFRLGDEVNVRLVEASQHTGGLVFNLNDMKKSRQKSKSKIKKFKLRSKEYKSL